MHAPSTTRAAAAREPQAIKPRIMLSIVAAFGLATAMERTGVARAVASSIVRLAQPLGACAWRLRTAAR